MSARDAGARLRAGVPALAPLAALYGAGLALSRVLGMRRRTEGPAAARVIAVGNLEVGGSGKTPLAMHLLAGASAAGRRVGYVSRGYGCAAARGPHVTVVPAHDDTFPEGSGGVRILDREGSPALEREIGDEAALVAMRVPAAIIAVGGDKRRAVDTVARMGVDVVVVDDAFQSWSLARSLDVVLLDAERPLGSGRLLPAGSLRERPDALRRADVVVFNGADDGAAVDAARSRVARWLAPQTVALGMRRQIGLERVAGDALLAGVRVLVVCGVARPERVRADVAAQGMTIAGEMYFADHHPYRAADVARIHAAAAGAGADGVVVTEKDWVKLRRFEWGGAVWVARLHVSLTGDADGLWRRVVR